ncbi:MOSC domain-containing protein [Kitasatospora camelliae]|uniref:MOSC N-terminal beta barrel domain-containing protein n=1 Tax=Kitasatospora camelliae TaxID=3156397 RepID=A0AAU8JSM9_9ACTN
MATLTGLHLYPVKSTYRMSPTSARVEPWGLEGDRRWMLVDPRGRALTQREIPALGQYRAVPRPDGTLDLTAPDGARIAIPAPSTAAGDPELLVEIWGTEVSAAEAAKEARDFLAERLGDVRLVHLDRPGSSRPVDPRYAVPGDTVSLADGYPLLLASTSSLADLNARIAADHPDDPRKAAPAPIERFRPNLVVDGTEPWAEDGWRRVRIGEVVFRVTKMCGRCVVTTIDQEAGERRGPEPLRALGRHRKFGDKLAFGTNLVPERPAGSGRVLGTLRLGDEVTVLEEGPRPTPELRA